MTGICGLCRCNRDLRDSHLLPAGAYRLARDPSALNPNPVLVSARGAVASSKQITAHFLCADCEQRFSSLGEAYVLTQCARPEGSFRIRETLRGMAPVATDGEVQVFDVGAARAEVQRFLYFAASVLWRAAAPVWPLSSAEKKCIVLGDRYGEAFRVYLLGEAPFPAEARLFVHVWSDDRIDFTSVVPSTYRIDGTYRHKFCIPGITFIAFVGGNASAKFDLGSLNGQEGSFMWICPWREDSLFASFGDLMKAALTKRRRPA